MISTQLDASSCSQPCGDVCFQDDEDEQPLATLAHAKSLSPNLIAAVQEQYNLWDESDTDTFAGGGICHLIADALVGVLSDGGVFATSVSSTFEQHVYVVCKMVGGVWSLDIPYSYYERGGGFSWTKIPGVTFVASDLVWHHLDSDPATFDDYVDF